MPFKNFHNELYEVNITYTTKWKNMNKSLIQQSLNAVIQALFSKHQNQKLTSQNTHPKLKFFTLGVLLTQDKTVQSYNKQYRNKDKPTNVLSFQGYNDITDLYDTSNVKVSSGNILRNERESDLNQFEQEPPHLGDLIFGYETIQKELEDLKEENTCFNSYFCNLCVHGLLHLFDIHHDTLEDESKMNEIAKKCADILEIEFIL